MKTGVKLQNAVRYTLYTHITSIKTGEHPRYLKHLNYSASSQGGYKYPYVHIRCILQYFIYSVNDKNT